MAYHLRFCNWFLLACVGLLFGACHVALGGSATVTFVFPSDGGSCGCQNVYLSTDGVNYTAAQCGVSLTCNSSSGTGPVDTIRTWARCHSGGTPVAMSLQDGGTYVFYLNAPGCAENGPTMATNYIQCITWTNNTGIGRAFTFYQSGEGCGTNATVSGDFAGYVFAGGTISRCFTNRCPNAIHLYVAPYQGAPRDDWINPEDEVRALGTNTVVASDQSANAAGPFQMGLGAGAGISPGNEGGNGTNSSPSTNLVFVFRNGVTNGISGGGATSQDIYSLGDALIRSGQQNTDRIIASGNSNANRIVNALTNGLGSGTNGTGAIVDAIENLNDDVNEGFQGVHNSLGTNGLLHRDLTNMNAALRGEGLNTNSYGNYGAAITGAGTAFGDAGYSTVTNAAGAYFGTGFTQGLAGSESGLLIDLAGSSSYPGSTLAKLDFRPSAWLSSLSVACVAIKALAGAFCAALLYIVIWRDMEDRMRSLNAASQVTGRSLAGASIIGSTLGLTIKTAVSTIITVGLAGLPTAVSAIGGGGFSVSFLEIAQSAAGGSGAGTLGSKMGTVWQWLGLMVPFGVILTACLNLWAWKVFAFAFETLWHIVFRLLPAFLVFYYVVTIEARDWIIDNRLPESVAILAGMDEGDDVMWYKPGVHLAPGLLDNLTVAYGLGTSNHIAIEPENTAEWVRVIISETYGVPYTAYVRIQYEHGFRWAFERGFILGCASVIIAGVIWFGRRTMSLGFGRYSE